MHWNGENIRRTRCAPHTILHTLTQNAAQEPRRKTASSSSPSIVVKNGYRQLLLLSIPFALLTSNAHVRSSWCATPCTALHCISMRYAAHAPRWLVSFSNGQSMIGSTQIAHNWNEWHSSLVHVSLFCMPSTEMQVKRFSFAFMWRSLSCDGFSSPHAGMRHTTQNQYHSIAYIYFAIELFYFFHNNSGSANEIDAIKYASAAINKII